jgi:hypothetical protein
MGMLSEIAMKVASLNTKTLIVKEVGVKKKTLNQY